MSRIVQTAAMVGAACGWCCAQTPPPVVTSPEWFTWYQSLLSQRLAECPRERGQSYYFSQAGSDEAGDGSISSPWKTVAKAHAVLAASTDGDVAVLFRRGDVWREQLGIWAFSRNVTIADYGSGEKPLLTTFQTIGSSGWTPAKGWANTYQRAEAGVVAWVKEDDDLDRPYSRQASAAGVSANEGSWYWDSAGVLYIHPRHTAAGVASDPRTDGKPYELAHPTESGLFVIGDGTRVENIRTQGWGMNPAGITQNHGIDCRVSGTNKAVFVGCESHYGQTHVMTHYVQAASGGGIATFVDCKAGLTAGWGGDGGTMFNTYAAYGGNETIFHHCTATHGTLPSSNFPAGQRAGMGFYGHTDNYITSIMGLTISYGCVIRDTPHGCASPSGFSNLPFASSLDEVRCFVVHEVFEGGRGTGELFQIGNAGAARVNGRYLNVRPPPLWSGALAAWTAGGWVINCTVEVDFSDQAMNVALFNGPNGWPNTVQIWNSHISFRTPPGIVSSIDWDFPPSQPSTATLVRSIVSNTGGGACIPNVGGAGGVRGNAYWGVSPQGLAEDPNAVVLGSWPAVGGEPACGSALSCSAIELPGGVTLGYDQRGEQRFRNTVGPVQSARCGNCDGSGGTPAFTANDFQCFINLFASGSVAANCDGSTGVPAMTANDFQCFLNVFASGCQ